MRDDLEGQQASAATTSANHGSSPVEKDERVGGQDLNTKDSGSILNRMRHEISGEEIDEKDLADVSTMQSTLVI